MKKILLILLVMGSYAFSDCRINAEYGIKKIVNVLNVNSKNPLKQGKVEKVYKFLGVDNELGTQYVYEINILNNNVSEMLLYGVVDVVSGELYVKSDIHSPDVMMVSERDPKAICN